MMEPSTRCSTGGPLPGDDGGDDGGDARGDVGRRRRRRPATGQPVGRSPVGQSVGRSRRPRVRGRRRRRRPRRRPRRNARRCALWYNRRAAHADGSGARRFTGEAMHSIHAPMLAIRLEGGLLSPDILESAPAGDLPGQQPRDFGLDGSRSLTDEIAGACFGVSG